MTDSPYSIKALPDRMLEIRVAWGWDAHNERFLQGVTDFDTENYPTPPVAYYHGYTKGGGRSKKPIYIGKTISREDRADGHYLTAKLNNKPEADAVWAAAESGHAAASPGTASHLIRRESDGTLAYWPIVEISAWDNPDGKHPQAHAYSVARPVLKSLGIDIDFDDDNPEAQPEATTAADAGRPDSITQEYHMTPEEVQAAIAAALEGERAKVAAAAADAAKLEAATAEAVKAARAQWEAESAQNRRLPDFDGKAPIVSQFAHTRRYDSLSAGDAAFVVEMLNAAKAKGVTNGPSEALLHAVAIKTVEDKTDAGDAGRAVLKAMGIDPTAAKGTKANELNYSTQAGFGDEFVPTVFGTMLWNNVRAATFVLDNLPAQEFSGPGDNFPIPIEGSDPTWYRVGQATDLNATTGRPDATIGDSKVGTTNASMTLGKVGARVPYTGEIDEDSIIPWAAQLRRQMEISYREQMEHLVIDGDTATGATTNINHIGGTPTSTGTKQDLFLTFNGLRKSPLVTTTSNSRNAAGALGDADFLETLWLMGAAGLNASDPMKVGFIVDPNVAKKAAQLASVKTRDVFANATLENGLLAGIWSYKVYTSWFIHFKSAARLANTAGKVDQTTPANNTRGSILAVRWDQWLLGYKRRINFRLQEMPDSDSYQMIATARLGLIQRDTEASAITYNVGI